jgi:hypothetical protein
VIGVERKREVVGKFPPGIAADRVELGLGREHLLFVPFVRLDRLGQDDGALHLVVVVEGYVGERPLEPVGLLAALVAQRVAGIEAVDRELETVRRCELDDRLAVEPLAAVLGELIAAVVRDLHIGSRRRVGDRRGGPDIGAVRVEEVRQGNDVPVVRVRLDRSRFAQLVAAEHGDAERLVRVRPVHEARDLGSDLVQIPLGIVD